MKSAGFFGSLLSQSRMCGKSHVFPPGYRKGLRCGICATLTMRARWHGSASQRASCVEEEILHYLINRLIIRRCSAVIQFLVELLLKHSDKFVYVPGFRLGDLIESWLKFSIDDVCSFQSISSFSLVGMKVVDEPCKLGILFRHFLQFGERGEKTSIESYRCFLFPGMQNAAFENELWRESFSGRCKIIGRGPPLLAL